MFTKETCGICLFALVGVREAADDDMGSRRRGHPHVERAAHTQRGALTLGSTPPGNHGVERGRFRNRYRLLLCSKTTYI